MKEIYRAPTFINLIFKSQFIYAVHCKQNENKRGKKILSFWKVPLCIVECNFYYLLKNNELMRRESGLPHALSDCKRNTGFKKEQKVFI